MGEMTENKIYYSDHSSKLPQQSLEVPIFICTFAPETSRAVTHKSGLANRALGATVAKVRCGSNIYSLQKHPNYESNQ